MNISSNVIMELRSYSHESVAHSHDYNQWVLPISGDLEIEIGNRANRVSSNRGAFIHSHETHCFASADTNQFLVLDVMPSDGWIMNMDLPSFWELTPALGKYLQFAKDYLEQHKNDPASNALIKDLLLKLLSQNFLSQFDPRILAAKNWIDTHFAAPIDIKSIARHSHFSVSQLQRRFRRALGQGVGQYWRRLRLQQAQLLLKTQTGPIERIAHQVGYESLAAFSRSFTRCFGVSPSQWRDDARCIKPASSR